MGCRVNPQSKLYRDAVARGLVPDPGAPPVVPEPERSRDRVTLPLPPSANNLFLTTRGGKRVKTAEYRAWLAAAVPLLRELRRPALPCAYCYVLLGAVNPRSDGGNREKPILDASVEAGVIPDDCLKYVAGGSWGHEATDGPPAAVVWFDPWAPVTRPPATRGV